MPKHPITTADYLMWTFLLGAALTAAHFHLDGSPLFFLYWSALVAGGLLTLMVWGWLLPRFPLEVSLKITLRRSIPIPLLASFLIAASLTHNGSIDFRGTHYLNTMTWTTIILPYLLLLPLYLLFGLLPLLYPTTITQPMDLASGIPTAVTLPENPPFHPATMTTVIAIALPALVMTALAVMWQGLRLLS